MKACHPVLVGLSPRNEFLAVKQTDNFLNLDESLRKNRHTFTPESLQYCSRKHCTLVPKFTALHFPEITVFLFPVYMRSANCIYRPVIASACYWGIFERFICGSSCSIEWTSARFIQDKSAYNVLRPYVVFAGRKGS